MAHNEKQFLLGEGFQQRGRKHDVHPAILGFETGRVELGRRIRIKLESTFDAKTLLAAVCHCMQRTRHGTAQSDRGAQQMATHTRAFAIFFLLFQCLAHPTDLRMHQQPLVQFQVVIATDLARRILHSQFTPCKAGHPLDTHRRFRALSTTPMTLVNSTQIDIGKPW